MKRYTFQQEEYLVLHPFQGTVREVDYMLIRPLDLETGNILKLLSVWDTGDIYSQMSKIGTVNDLIALESTEDKDYELSPIAKARIECILQTGVYPKLEIKKKFLN